MVSSSFAAMKSGSEVVSGTEGLIGRAERSGYTICFELDMIVVLQILATVKRVINIKPVIEDPD